MKKHLLMSAFAATCSIISNAQSITYMYEWDMSQRTVEPFPNVQEYMLTQTATWSVMGPIPVVDILRYAQTGTSEATRVSERVMFSHTHDMRNVDLVYNPNNNKFFLTTFNQPTSGGDTYIKVHNLDANGNLLATSAFESADPNYPNLMALDAIYDAVLNQYVICGTAGEKDKMSPDVKKVAFVATVDINLNLTKIMFYESNPGSSMDYDIANRIVNVGGAAYYITGSENVIKNGARVMGIRNMLINPTTLVPYWRNPLQFTDLQSQENSVDMIVAPDPAGTLCFNVIANSTSGNKWYIYRVNVSTGLPYAAPNNNVSTLFGYRSYAHNITSGNSGNTVVVSGMKYRRLAENCNSWDQEATPFMATVDLSSWTGTLTKHIEYNTVISNNQYWGMGGFYSPSSGYPVPSYLNNFADRQGPGKRYSVVAPITGTAVHHYYPGMTGFLNTKFLNVDANTDNLCDPITCNYSFDFNFRVVNIQPSLTHYSPQWQPGDPTTDQEITADGVHPEFKKCESGYYRQNAASINSIDPAGISVYPIPAIDDIYIALGSSSNGKRTQVSLFDITGRQITVLYDDIVKESTMKFTLPGNISTGIYLLKISMQNDNPITKKIMINR